MSELALVTKDGEVRVDSRDLATGFKVSHKHLYALINSNIVDLEQFGHVPFQTEDVKSGYRGAKRSTKFALLNKLQAALVATFCRNTPAIKDYKVSLIKKMDQMEKVIIQSKSFGSLSVWEKWFIEFIRKMPGTIDVIEAMRPTNKFIPDTGLRRASFAKKSGRKKEGHFVNQFVMNFYPQIGDKK